MENEKTSQSEEQQLRLLAQLDQAKTQRLIALRHAFQIIDAFAIPSLNPEQMSNFDELKFVLINGYGEGVDLDEENKLRF